jgi:MFS family permease
MSDRRRTLNPKGIARGMRIPLPYMSLSTARRRVQAEAASYGVMNAINNAFITPLLVSRGAGALVLAIYSGFGNLFGFGSGFVGARLAARFGSVSRAALIALTMARLLMVVLAVTIAATPGGSPWPLVGIALGWLACEGLALPLWTSFIAGLAGPSERGRWLAMRATAATGATACVMIVLVVLLRVTSTDSALPIAYALAGIAGIISLIQMRALFHSATDIPVPPARSAHGFPAAPETRRFLGGVICFWLGVGLVGPVLVPYIIRDLGAPTAYFGLIAVAAALTGLVVQRRWGRLADEKGARTILLIAGIGAAMVPTLWGLVPVYWLGIGIEIIAASVWPGHLLGLTLRSMELATDDAERPTLLAWTNLAQGTGAAISPFVASALIGLTGPEPLLFAAGAFRLTGTLLIGQPSWRWLPARKGALTGKEPPATLPPGDGDG